MRYARQRQTCAAAARAPSVSRRCRAPRASPRDASAGKWRCRREIAAAAGEGVRRREEQGLRADEGVGAVVLSRRPPPGPPTAARRHPAQRGVALADEAGQGTLLHAETRAPIFTFTACFPGQVLYLFAVWREVPACL